MKTKDKKDFPKFNTFVLKGILFQVRCSGAYFNPGTGEVKTFDLCELKASLIYIDSSRTARAT